MIRHLLDRIAGKIPKGSKRSSRWPLIRKIHLQNNPNCIACGGTEKTQVHHVVPFHQKPELELDLTNLMTLCESGKNGIVCHLAIGHLGNFKKVNRESRADASWWRNKVKNR